MLHILNAENFSSRGYKNGEGRAEGGSRGEYAGRRDDFRGSQPRNNQRGDWDAPRDDYRGKLALLHK